MEMSRACWSRAPKMVPELFCHENQCVIFNLFESSSVASHGLAFRKSLTMVILCLECQTCRGMDLNMPITTEFSNSQINSLSLLQLCFTTMVLIICAGLLLLFFIFVPLNFCYEEKCAPDFWHERNNYCELNTTHRQL